MQKRSENGKEIKNFKMHYLVLLNCFSPHEGFMFFGRRQAVQYEILEHKNSLREYEGMRNSECFK